MITVLLFSLNLVAAAQPEALVPPAPAVQTDSASAASLPQTVLPLDFEPVTYAAASAFVFGSFVLQRRLRSRRQF